MARGGLGAGVSSAETAEPATPLPAEEVAIDASQHIAGALATALTFSRLSRS
jgi:hypothetical protein